MSGWIQVERIPGAGWPTLLWQDTVDPGVAWLGRSRTDGVLRSADGGKTFALLALPEPVRSLDRCRKKPARLWAAGQTALWVSTDDGKSWKKCPLRGLPPVAVNDGLHVACDPGEPDRVLIGVENRMKRGGPGVWRSSDGGESAAWIGISGPEESLLPAWQGRSVAALPGGGRLALGAIHASVFSIAPGRDLWRRSALPTRGSIALGGLAVDGGAASRAYVASTAGLWRTDSGGRSWRRILRGDVRAVALDRADPGRLAAALGSGGVWLSENGGRAGKRIPGPTFRHVAFAGENLIAADEKSVYRWML